MATRSLVFVSYGNRDEQIAETKYAVLSAIRLVHPSDDFEVVIYTDSPRRFSDMPARLRPISQEEFAAWAGPADYHFRRKLEAIRDALSQTGHPVVYVDSDAWFRKPPARLFARVGRDRSVMHIREGSLRNPAFTPVYREFVACLERGAWSASNGDPLKITSDVSWNAGVIGLDPWNRVLVDDAVALVDQVASYEWSIGILEQFAIAFFLSQNTDLSVANDVVFHYWPKYLKEAFDPILLRELDRTAHLDVSERARELHRIRPRLHGVAQVKYVMKQAYRRTGRAWTIPGSAT